MKVEELEGALLDLWVARAEGYEAKIVGELGNAHDEFCMIAGRRPFMPSTDWSDGGPLIYKYALAIQPDCHMDEKDKSPGIWYADDWDSVHATKYSEITGRSPLEVICRAVVRSKFGDEIEEA